MLVLTLALYKMSEATRVAFTYAEALERPTPIAQPTLQGTKFASLASGILLMLAVRTL